MERYTRGQKKLIGALIGLARSLDETNADFAVLEEMVAGIRMIGGKEEEMLLKQIEKIHKVRDRMVPDCSRCKNPCGRTEDYDLDGLDGLEPALAERKYRLLKQIRTYVETMVWDEEDYAGVLHLLADALFSVGYDWLDGEQIAEKTERLMTK